MKPLVLQPYFLEHLSVGEFLVIQLGFCVVFILILLSVFRLTMFCFVFFFFLFRKFLLCHGISQIIINTKIIYKEITPVSLI